MRPRLYLLIITVLSVLTPLTPAWPESGAAGEALQPVTVTTGQVRRLTISSPVEVVGTIQAVDQATIAARIAGTITEIPVVLGSTVSRGDLLVRLSAEEISARAMQARAQLAQARRNLNREEKLLKENASTPETVKSMRDMLAIAEAGYREAESLLAYTTINAPFSGVITRKIASVGDLATPGTPLLQLEDPSRYQVVAAVPESLTVHLRAGDRLDCLIPALNGERTGTVNEISPVIDPGSRTARVKINLEKSSGLRTGMFARVRLKSTRRTGLLIPLSAVVPFGQLHKVFVVKDNRARLRLVRIGVRKDDLVEILAGLEEGETVVTGNNRLLVDGQLLQTGEQ